VADKASEQCIGGERRVHTVGSDSVSFKETCAALTNFLHNHFLIISIITHSQQKKKKHSLHISVLLVFSRVCGVLKFEKKDTN
jgi:hypothetical protein